MRIAIVCAERPGRTNAIGAHAAVIADALRATGNEVDVRTQEPLFANAETYDALVLEYNPFLYGRGGVAPRLVWSLWRLRGPRVVLAVHEPFVEKGILGLWQRLQLFLLRAAADTVLVSIDAWTSRLARWRPRRPTAHLPSGSTLPDARAERAAARADLGIPDETLAVATLSGGHPSHLEHHVRAALEALAPRSTIHVALGSKDGAEWLPDRELARRLAATDLFLAPLVDGVSTRRTSVMAALQQEVAVVGTRGPLTDPELADTDALALAPAHDEAAFAALARRFALDDDARRTLAARGRRLYEHRYSGERLAAILLDACR